MPSLRPPKRYLVFEIISEKELDFKDVKKEFENAILKFSGQLGYANINPKFIKGSKFIIQINHKYVDLVRTIAATIRKIDKTEAIVKCVKVSGILKKTRC